MPTNKKREKKIITTVRLAQSVREFCDKKAEEEDIRDATLMRNVVSAGLKSLYGVKIRNNQIVK